MGGSSAVEPVGVQVACIIWCVIVNSTVVFGMCRPSVVCTLFVCVCVCGGGCGGLGLCVCASLSFLSLARSVINRTYGVVLLSLLLSD